MRHRAFCNVLNLASGHLGIFGQALITFRKAHFCARVTPLQSHVSSKWRIFPLCAHTPTPSTHFDPLLNHHSRSGPASYSLLHLAPQPRATRTVSQLAPFGRTAIRTHTSAYIQDRDRKGCPGSPPNGIDGPHQMAPMAPRLRKKVGRLGELKLFGVARGKPSLLTRSISSFAFTNPLLFSSPSPLFSPSPTRAGYKSYFHA